MVTVIKSIGTAGRDYSTITLWEADLDNAAIYAAGDHAVGECYDDSVFNESVTINGGGTIGLGSITLTVAAGERHDGTAGTGARIVRSVQSSVALLATSTNRHVDIGWLEIDTSAGNFGLSCISMAGLVGNEIHRAFNTICHGVHTSSGNSAGSGISGQNNITYLFFNNIVYDVSYNGGLDTGSPIGMGSTQTLKCFNNTVFGVHILRATSTAVVVGINYADSANRVVQNNVVCDVTTAGSGAASCFSPATNVNATVSHNAASDTTATGTGSLDSIVTADQFVSTVNGSEDLHLKEGADCIDAGVDLGVTPSGVQFDINNRDRDAEGDVWDIGAHEFIAVGGSIVPAPYYYNMAM